MSEQKKSASVGGDGMGDFLGVGGGAKGSPATGPPDFTRFIAGAVASAGSATLVPIDAYTRIMARVYRLFSATSADDKVNVDVNLAIFFAVHGTSPRARWSEMSHRIVVNGVRVAPYDVVKEIGSDTLKRFLGRFSAIAIAAYNTDAGFRSAMRERVVRANLPEESGYLAIDYLGKDGGLDPATMEMRRNAKAHLIGARNDEVRASARDTASGYAQARDVTSSSGDRHDVFG